MRQFVLKSILSLSLSVGALSASINSTDLGETGLPSASSSATSTALTTPPHPASIPMQYYSEIMAEDGQSIGEYAHVGYLKSLAKEKPFIMQEILSYLDANDLFNLYKAGYINGFMWKAVEGKRDFVDASNLPVKLLVGALGIQTKDPALFLKEQGKQFAQSNWTKLFQLLHSKVLRYYLSHDSEMRVQYDSLRHRAGSHYGGKLRLVPPRDFMDEQRQDAGRHVTFPDNMLTFLSDLKNVGEVTQILVQYNYLQVLPNLSVFSSLEHLQAHNNQICRVEGLGQLTGLRTVNLSHNKLSDIKGFEEQTSIETLVLAQNELQGALDLSQLTKVGHLALQENQITHVKGLEKMTALGYLDLSGNSMVHVPALNTHTYLMFLYLSNTGFTTLENIGNLSNLSVCTLKGNGLRALDSLSHNLPALKTLHLDNNQLTSLAPLTRLGALHTLSISGNPLSTLEDLEHLSRLRTLRMRDMAHLGSLATMPQATRTRLSDLDVYGNTFIKMPEIKQMQGLQNISMERAQWNDRDNRLALQHLVDNDTISERGPTVLVVIPCFNGGAEDAECVRSRSAGEHGEAIAIPITD